jgi:DNA polymerase-3 subunit gamma/tau
MFSGLALGAIAVYLGLVATAFLGGPDIVTPLLPKPPASANDAARQVPAIAPSSTGVPSAVPEQSAPPTPLAPDTVATLPSTEPTTEPAPVAPAPTEPATDEPGKSEAAPGKTNTPEPPQRP